jgi:hypothetical protein
VGEQAEQATVRARSEKTIDSVVTPHTVAAAAGLGWHLVWSLTFCFVLFRFVLFCFVLFSVGLLLPFGHLHFVACFGKR